MPFATRMMSMMALSLQIITALLFIITVVTVSSSPPGGFTVDLIHRRSNSSSTGRSNTYDDQLRSSPYADVIYDTTTSGGYLMKLQIGTPPVEIEALIDTGSGVMWTQCLPCLNCYHQRNPIFNPSKSSTYKDLVRCNNTPDHSCVYDIVYGDQSYTIGSFATETVALKSTSGQSYVMPKTIIGCSHNSSEYRRSFSGIVGLNLRPSSLVSQMGIGAISYCFSPEGRSSKIHFGSNAIVSGEGTVSTTMFMNKEKSFFYYLNLEAVSVEETRIETLGTPFHAVDGNMIIDSGSTYTYLPASYCSLVREAVEKVVRAERVTYQDDDSLCYKTDTMDIFPVITMHFSGGADLVLGKNNTYMSFNGEGAICLTIVCGSPLAPNHHVEEAIFGNKAQNNFLVGYDLSSRLVSFKPTSDCGDIPIDDHSISAASLFQFNINFVLFLFVLSLIN